MTHSTDVDYAKAFLRPKNRAALEAKEDSLEDMSPFFFGVYTDDLIPFLREVARGENDLPTETLEACCGVLGLSRSDVLVATVAP